MSVARKLESDTTDAAALLAALKPRAKSLIVTVYGDAILPHGGEAWLGDLIRLMECFGISERLVRTSVFRLTQDGVLAARQVGRRSIYALTPGGRRAFDAAQRKIYAPLTERRDPDENAPWTIALLGGSVDAEQRDALHRELGWAGFGMLGTQALIGTGSDLQRAKDSLTTLGLEDRVTLFEATANSAAGTLRALCHEAWHLDATDQDYRAFIRRFTPLRDRLLAPSEKPAPKEAFTLRILMIHAYRRALLRDPGLPTPLMPDNWSGRTARQLAAEIYDNLQYNAQDFVETGLHGTDGPLPPSAPQFSARFLRLIPD
ncbi:phenylacetic acid degradation operon negative regulatory protein PaaX [Nisaea acidiphila]|uniref:Phenylacetic acid degradation operon negative regulatory protein PaaX n=1 Tax=Nisaea acidiphila TaxID=1862145 RepID=A0A9J7AU00_9PROT|nr:PaaX family transcriptional regulator C-terminal domain-containing protein [Nisaea acidiphila]UUX50306.1 phenylacetic acid degradation operon negative regulatory protein PaaX [Nisaea acidiphila]